MILNRNENLYIFLSMKNLKWLAVGLSITAIVLAFIDKVGEETSYLPSDQDSNSSNWEDAELYNLPNLDEYGNSED